MTPDPEGAPGRSRLSRGVVVVLTAVVLAGAGLVAVVLHQVGTPSRVAVRLVAFNDFHGSLRPNEGTSGVVTRDDGTTVEAGGAAFMATHIARLRASAPNTVLLSVGDNAGTSQLPSALFHDEPTIALLNTLGVAASVVGNHEFDKGLPELLRMQRGGCHPLDGCRFRTTFPGATFPFLGANVSTDDGRHPLPASTIVVTGGVRIGVIGATLRDTAGVVPADVLQGLQFGDEVEAINRASDELTAQGVKAQVVLLHQGDDATGGPDACGVEPGGPASAIARRVSPQVDVIFTGHTHQQYVCSLPDPAGVPRPVVQGLSHGRLLSVVDLTVENGDVVRDRTVASNTVVTRDVRPDPTVEALVAEAAKQAGPIAGRRVGSITADLLRTAAPSGESPLGDVLADAQLTATRKNGAQVALVNPDGLRGDLRAGANGAVTYGEVFAMLPFARTVQTLTITGARLEDVLEQQSTTRILQVSSSLHYSWVRQANQGVKVSDVRIDGRPVDFDERYRVSVDDFLAAGGNGFTGLAQGTDVVAGPTDIDALLAHLAESRIVSPPAANRIKTSSP